MLIPVCWSMLAYCTERHQFSSNVDCFQGNNKSSRISLCSPILSYRFFCVLDFMLYSLARYPLISIAPRATLIKKTIAPHAMKTPYETCKDCNGTGHDPDNFQEISHQCLTCNGNGQLDHCDVCKKPITTEERDLGGCYCSDACFLKACEGPAQ